MLTHVSRVDEEEPMVEALHVAVVGTGRMGAAMAARLRRSGADVTVYNRTRSKAEEVAAATGARVAASAREAAGSAPVVITSLADDEAVRATYAGEDGLVAGLRGDAIVLETSTIDPETVQGLGPAVQRSGARLLDAPVSGSVPVVERGELMVMAGGDAGALERARPALEPLATRVLHVGPLGAGATMKLAVNALVHALNTGLAEALVLAERAGVPREVAYEVFASSAGAAPFLHYKRAAYEQPEATPVAFSLDLVGKDLDLIVRLGSRVGAPLRQAEVNRALVTAASEQGLGEQDMSALATFLRSVAAGR